MTVDLFPERRSSTGEQNPRTECRVGVFSPKKQNPTAHLQVLRNPTHHLTHSDDYLSPTLHNVSHLYIDRLIAQARNEAPWLLAKQPVRVSKVWRSFQDSIDTQCPTFTLKEVRKKEKRNQVGEDVRYSERLNALNAMVETEMLQKGWKFTRKEWEEIKDAVSTERRTSLSIKADTYTSTACGDIQDSASSVSPRDIPAPPLDDYALSWISSQAIPMNLGITGELETVAGPKHLAEPLLSRPSASAKTSTSQKCTIGDVSLSIISETESLEYSLTISDTSQGSADTLPTPPMTPKLESTQFESIGVSQDALRFCYSSSVFSDSDYDSDEDDARTFSPAKTEQSCYLKDFRESRLSAQTQLSIQAKAEKKKTMDHNKLLRDELAAKFKRENEIYHLCNIISLQLIMDMENIRLTGMTSEGLTYRKESGSCDLEVRLAGGIINTLSQNGWFNARLVDKCTYRLKEEGNWQLLEDPRSVPENLVGRSESDLEEWAELRFKYIEQERQQTPGSFYEKETFEEAKKRMQFRFIWDAVIDELESACGDADTDEEEDDDDGSL